MSTDKFSVVGKQHHPELLEGKASLAEGVVAVLVFRGVLKVLGFTIPRSGYDLTKAPFAPFSQQKRAIFHGCLVAWRQEPEYRKHLSNLLLVWEAEGWLIGGWISSRPLCR